MAMPPASDRQRNPLGSKDRSPTSMRPTIDPLGTRRSRRHDLPPSVRELRSSAGVGDQELEASPPVDWRMGDRPDAETMKSQIVRRRARNDRYAEPRRTATF